MEKVHQYSKQDITRVVEQSYAKITTRKKTYQDDPLYSHSKMKRKGPLDSKWDDAKVFGVNHLSKIEEEEITVLLLG